MDSVKRSSDYSGVSSIYLAALLREQKLDALTMDQREVFCEEIDVNPRWFSKIIYNEVAFIGLNIADRFCLGMGLDVSDVLTVIPSAYPQAAEKMAADEYWAMGMEPTEAEIEERAAELRLLRATVMAAAVILHTSFEAA